MSLIFSMIKIKISKLAMTIPIIIIFLSFILDSLLG